MIMLQLRQVKVNIVHDFDILLSWKGFSDFFWHPHKNIKK